MTVYIFGGSNTARQRGWAGSFAQQVLRKVPVQNLAIGATNSINALTRLMGDVTLRENDVVVWVSATNDALCLSQRAYDAAVLLECFERMIRITREAGARFIPVLIDTFEQHLMVQQAGYAEQVERVCAHYQLEVVNLPRAYARETGTMRARAEFFMDPLHLLPGGELCEYVAELTVQAWQAGGSYPADVAPLHVPEGVELELFDSFSPAESAEAFESSIISKQAWMPPISAVLPKRPGMRTEIQALTIVSDPVEGRFEMRSDGRSVVLAANHEFGFTGRPLISTLWLRLLQPEGMFAAEDGSPVQVNWDMSRQPVASDMYLKPTPDGPSLGHSTARVVSLLLRHVPVVA